MILLSLLIFVMAFQLMITRTERDVRLLTDLGVRTAHIVRHYAWVFAVSMVVLALVDLAAFLVAKRILTSILAERGLELPGGHEGHGRGPRLRRVPGDRAATPGASAAACAASPCSRWQLAAC